MIGDQTLVFYWICDIFENSGSARARSNVLRNIKIHKTSAPAAGILDGIKKRFARDAASAACTSSGFKPSIAANVS